MRLKTQIVDFCVAEPVHNRVLLSDRFALRPELGYVWLQRAAVWVLRKIGCYAIDYTTSFKRYRLDTRTLVEMIRRQVGSLDAFYHKRAERVLIGSEDFANLMGELEAPNALFTHSQVLQMHQAVGYNQDGSYKTETRVCGLKVTVVPWMRGILVLPKDIE